MGKIIMALFVSFYLPDVSALIKTKIFINPKKNTLISLTILQ